MAGKYAIDSRRMLLAPSVRSTVSSTQVQVPVCEQVRVPAGMTMPGSTMKTSLAFVLAGMSTVRLCVVVPRCGWDRAAVGGLFAKVRVR